MTSDGFRCSRCEAILTAVERLTGTMCRDCWKHTFDPDPTNGGRTCLVCGYDRGFALLHPEPVVELDGYELPPVCPTCTHYAHDKGPCYVVLRRWPTEQVCGCRQAVAS